jgi:hypothetical protein
VCSCCGCTKREVDGEISGHGNFADVIKEDSSPGAGHTGTRTRLRGFRTYEITVPLTVPLAVPGSPLLQPAPFGPDTPHAVPPRASLLPVASALRAQSCPTGGQPLHPCCTSAQENVRYFFIHSFFKQPDAPAGPCTGEPTAVAGQASAQGGQRKVSFAAFHSASFQKPPAKEVEMRPLHAYSEDGAEELEETVDVVVERQCSRGAVLAEPPALGRPPSPPIALGRPPSPPIALGRPPSPPLPDEDVRDARRSMSTSVPGIVHDAQTAGSDSDCEADPLLGRSGSVRSTCGSGADLDSGFDYDSS